MILAQDIIDELEDMPDAPEVKLVDRQIVADIIRFMPWKLERSRPYYDRIWMFFDTNASDSVEDIAEAIFDFLKSEMVYVEEDDEEQNLSTPKQLLEVGTCDCKGYALFTAGVIDAINRNSGLPEIPWCFRFVPSEILGTKIGHVFVVLFPGDRSDELWIDPVLDTLNQKPIYLTMRDKYVQAGERVAGLKVSATGELSGTRVGSAEDDLLSQLVQYQQGLIEAVQLSQTTGTMNSITKLVVTGITSVLVPGLAIALKVLSLAQTPLNNAFGPGSVAARVYSDITSLNFVSLFNDIFKGRTYNSDQYWGAAFYYFYVEGKNITNQDQVTDAMLMPALKWFIDRTGVFISGRQHIMGLIAGESDYLQYAQVNSDTTTNTEMVDAAVQVAQKYWLISGTPNENYATFDQSLKGSWANTVGVFDTGLTAIAASLGETAETYAAQTGDQYAINETEGLPATAPTWQAKLVEIFKKPLAWVLAGAVAAGVVFLIFDDE